MSLLATLGLKPRAVVNESRNRQQAQRLLARLEQGAWHEVEQALARASEEGRDLLVHAIAQLLLGASLVADAWEPFFRTLKEAEVPLQAKMVRQPQGDVRLRARGVQAQSEGQGAALPGRGGVLRVCAGDGVEGPRGHPHAALRGELHVLPWARIAEGPRERSEPGFVHDRIMRELARG